MDCRQVEGHWIALTLSLILFNVGIALASFASAAGSEGWKIVGAVVIVIGFILIAAIPLLIRRNMRSRLHEAFICLSEEQMNQKRCNGHCIAWSLSVIHLILGISIISYASDINSDGWIAVGLVIVALGVLLMVGTSILIKLNIQKIMHDSSYHSTISIPGEEKDILISEDTTNAPFLSLSSTDSARNVMETSYINNSPQDTNIGFVYMAIDSTASEPDAVFRPLSSSISSDKKSKSLPIVIDDTDEFEEEMGESIDSPRRLTMSLPDIPEPTIMTMQREHIEQISSMMDSDIHNWRLFAERIVSNNKSKLVGMHKQFLHIIDQYETWHFNAGRHGDKLFVYLQNKQSKLGVNAFLHIAEDHELNNVVNFIQTKGLLYTSNGEDAILNNIDNENKDALAQMLNKLVKEDWVPFSNSLPNFTEGEIADLQLTMTSEFSATSKLFELFQSELPSLTLKEVYTALKYIGRLDVANYIEHIFLYD